MVGGHHLHPRAVAQNRRIVARPGQHVGAARRGQAGQRRRQIGRAPPWPRSRRRAACRPGPRPRPAARSAGSGGAGMAGSSSSRSMNARSMRSFQRQSSGAVEAQPPFVGDGALAARGDELEVVALRAVGAQRAARPTAPRAGCATGPAPAARQRPRPSGAARGPCARNRPAAKIAGSDDCSVGPTVTKPSVRARPVAGQPALRARPRDGQREVRRAAAAVAPASPRPPRCRAASAPVSKRDARPVQMRQHRRPRAAPRPPARRCPPRSSSVMRAAPRRAAGGPWPAPVPRRRRPPPSGRAAARACPWPRRPPTARRSPPSGRDGHAMRGEARQVGHGRRRCRCRARPRHSAIAGRPGTGSAARRGRCPWRAPRISRAPAWRASRTRSIIISSRR